MTGRSEGELADALAHGDRTALAEAIELLGVPHAYTAARAAEMLATQGGADGHRALIGAALADQPHPVAWYGLSVAVDASRGWPGTPGEQGEALRRIVGDDVHPDVVWWGTRVFRGAPLQTRRCIVDRWIASADDALVVELAVLVREVEPLPAAWLERLARVRGEGRAVALAFVVRDGTTDPSTLADAATVAVDGGPHAFELFDALEQSRARADGVRDVLRRAASSRWRTRPEHVRAAGVLAAWGDAEGLSSLRRFARRRRVDLRGVAWVELLRHGAEADVADVRRRVLGADEPASEYVVAEAWRSSHPGAGALVAEALASHGEASVRLAAIEAAFRIASVTTGDAIEAAANADADPEVRRSARAALAALAEVKLGVERAAAGAEAIEESVDPLDVHPLERADVDDAT